MKFEYKDGVIWANPDKEEDIRRYMPGILIPNPLQAEGYVQPYGDSPLDRENVSESVF